MATVRAQVAVSLHADWENYTTFKPGSRQERPLQVVLVQVIAWGCALKALRWKK